MVEVTLTRVNKAVLIRIQHSAGQLETGCYPVSTGVPASTLASLQARH